MKINFGSVYADSMCTVGWCNPKLYRNVLMCPDIDFLLERGRRWSAVYSPAGSCILYSVGLYSCIAVAGGITGTLLAQWDLI